MNIIITEKASISESDERLVIHQFHTAEDSRRQTDFYPCGNMGAAVRLAEALLRDTSPEGKTGG